MSTLNQNEKIQELMDTYASDAQANAVMNLRAAGYEFVEMKNYIFEDDPFDSTERYMFVLEDSERVMLVLQSGKIVSPKPKSTTTQNQ